jgi:hypothetical protein
MSVVVLLAFFFLRNGESIAHQTHAVLAVASFSFAFLVILLARTKKARWVVIPFAVVFFIFDENSLPFTKVLSSGIAKVSLSFDELQTLRKRDEKLDMWEQELLALSEGRRIIATEYSQSTLRREFSGPDSQRTSIVHAWAVLPNVQCDDTQGYYPNIRVLPIGQNSLPRVGEILRFKTSPQYVQTIW